MKRKYLILINVLLFGFSVIYSQSNNKNYILSRAYTKQNGSKSLVTIQYFDGLGRPVQTVQKGFTPNEKDLITLQEYDSFGRESKLWLPVPQEGSTGEYVEPNIIINNPISLYDYDPAAYSNPTYEPSQLNRVIQQFGPGQEWRNSPEKSIIISYKTNSSSEVLLCKQYTVSNDNPNYEDDHRTGTLYG